VLPSGQKLASDLVAHHYLRTSPLPPVCTVANASAIFKRILEAVLCNCVQHRQLFCLHHLSCVKIAAFHFNIQYRKIKKNMVGTTVCCFGKKVRGENRSVRRCIVFVQQPDVLSPKVEAKSSHIFTQSPQNITVVCRIHCLACQDEFFVSIPLMSKKIINTRLTLFFTCMSFSVWASLNFPCTAHAFFSESLPNHFRVYVAPFPRFTQYLMNIRCRIHGEITSGMIHDCK
jgi:hypothetical protein